MSPVRSISDPAYVSSQYRDATNLNARIRLHQEFSTNKHGWQRWLFEQFQLSSHERVLELGCGAGTLWQENLERLPQGCDIGLSDLSVGMTKQALRNLKRSPVPFQFQVIDAQVIPYEDDFFDVVIASHMLYHVPDIDKALQEIRRVLKHGGRFYASTIGCDHLKEITDLIHRFDPGQAFTGSLPPDTFTLENGAAILGAHFALVSGKNYPDALLVTNANLLADYILSGRLAFPADRRLDFRNFIARELEANGGKLFISKSSGVFEACNAHNADEFYAQTYDAAVPDWPGEIDFYRQMTSSCGGAVLEVACGTGRVALRLAQDGASVLGLDLSAEMIEIARRKSQGLENMRWVLADMRDFDLGENFSLALIPGHAFQNLNTPQDQVACLECIRRHLKPGGMLVVHLDHMNGENMRWLGGLCGEQGGVFNMEEPFIHPQSGNQVVASRAWSYEPSTQGAIVQTVWEERDGGGRLIRRLVRDPIRLHCVFRFEMEHLLDRAGYTIEAVFGDFFKRPLLDDSPSMVWLAKRA